MSSRNSGPKVGLTTQEKALFRRISRDLEARGTLNQTPIELLIDYVQLDTRVARLNAMVDSLDDPKLQLGAMRQFEAAVTQRRQLANCPFPPVEVGKKTLRAIAGKEAPADDWLKLVQ